MVKCGVLFEVRTEFLNKGLNNISVAFNPSCAQETAAAGIRVTL
jgi:hypothetical protein